MKNLLKRNSSECSLFKGVLMNLNVNKILFKLLKTNNFSTLNNNNSSSNNNDDRNNNKTIDQEISNSGEVENPSYLKENLLYKKTYNKEISDFSIVDLEKDFNKYLKESLDDSNKEKIKASKKQKQPLRIVEVDFHKGMRARKEYFVDPITNEKIDLREVKNKYNIDYKQNKENTQQIANQNYLKNKSVKSEVNESKDDELLNNNSNSDVKNDNIDTDDTTFKNHIPIDNSTPIFQGEYIIGKNTYYPIDNKLVFNTKQFNKEIKLQTYYYPAYFDILNNLIKVDDIVNKEYLNSTENEHIKNYKPKGVVVIYHGMYEHNKHLAYVAKLLSMRGYEVHSYDYRGHGLSEGTKGLIESKEVFINDGIEFLSLINKFYSENDNSNMKLKKELSEMPIYTLGYSLGGLLSTLVNQLNTGNPDYLKALSKVKAQILFAGAMTEDSIPEKERKILKFTSPFFRKFPNWRSPVKVRFNRKYENKLVVDYLLNDELMYLGYHYFGTGFAIQDLMKENIKNKENMRSPIFFIQGENDKIVNLEANKKFVQEITESNSKDNKEFFNKNKFLIVNNMAHMIPFDYRIESFIDEVDNWISSEDTKNKLNYDENKNNKI